MYDKLDAALREALDELNSAAWAKKFYEVVACGEHSVTVRAERMVCVEFDLEVTGMAIAEFDALMEHIEEAFEAELVDGVGYDDNDEHIIFGLSKPKS